jgi:hypothetical protein
MIPYRSNSLKRLANLTPTVFTLAVTLAVLGLIGAGFSQQVTVARLQPEDSLSNLEKSGDLEPAPVAAPIAPIETSFVTSHTHPAHMEHRFWDRENTFLFAANAAFSAADFVITRDNLRGGGRELNPVTGLFAGSTAGLAVNFAGEAAGVVGLSYMLHRTGHHRLERLVSVVNLGSSAAAVSFDLAHR